MISQFNHTSDVSWFEYRENDCPVSPDHAEMVIHRKGQCVDLVRYSAFDIRGNEIGFRWGEYMKTLKPGRYIGTLYIDECERCDYEFRVDKSCDLRHIRDDVSTMSACCEPEKEKNKPHDCEPEPNECQERICNPVPECDACGVQTTE